MSVIARRQIASRCAKLKGVAEMVNADLDDVFNEHSAKFDIGQREKGKHIESNPVDEEYGQLSEAQSNLSDIQDRLDNTKRMNAEERCELGEALDDIDQVLRGI